MDEKDRTCSAPGQIPAHLRFAIDGWLDDMLRQGDGLDGPPEAQAVIEAVRLRDALVAGTLTAEQIAGLAGGAVRWLRQGRAEVAAEDAGRRARAARELVALRDRALVLASRPSRRPRVMTADAEAREVLRGADVDGAGVRPSPLRGDPRPAPGGAAGGRRDLPRRRRRPGHHQLAPCGIYRTGERDDHAGPLRSAQATSRRCRAVGFGSARWS